MRIHPQNFGQKRGGNGCVETNRRISHGYRLVGAFTANKSRKVIETNNVTAGYRYSLTEAPPFRQEHAHLGGVWLRPTHVTKDIKNALLLEPEQPLNAQELLRTCHSYIATSDKLIHFHL